MTMTKNKKAKLAARAYSQATGVSYVAAQRLTGGGSGGPVGPQGPDGDGAEWDDWEGFEPMSLPELLAGAPQGACDRLIGDDIGEPGSDQLLTLNTDFIRGVSEPTVHQFEMSDLATDIQVQEEYEGGTLACTVVTTGTLIVHALMAKGDAVMAQEAGQVEVVDPDFNRHYAAVTFEVDAEATFMAIVNPEYEGLEDFTLDGMTLSSN